MRQNLRSNLIKMWHINYLYLLLLMPLSFHSRQLYITLAGVVSVTVFQTTLPVCNHSYTYLSLAVHLFIDNKTKSQKNNEVRFINVFYSHFGEFAELLFLQKLKQNCSFLCQQYLCHFKNKELYSNQTCIPKSSAQVQLYIYIGWNSYIQVSTGAGLHYLKHLVACPKTPLVDLLFTIAVIAAA